MATTAVLLLLLATATVAPRDAGAMEYTVGDSAGWSIGPNYLTWSQQYNFTTGDTLAFNYLSGQHDVLQVMQDAFRTCEPAAGQTVRKWASGQDVVDLDAPREYYFLCNITGHCLGGMKFSIAVAAPAPPPPPTPPPPEFPTQAPPPPPPSSGASLSGQLGWPGVVKISCLAGVALWLGLLF